MQVCSPQGIRQAHSQNPPYSRVSLEKPLSLTWLRTAQKGTPAQAGALDSLVVIGAFDAKDADPRADVDQHEGVDGGSDHR